MDFCVSHLQRIETFPCFSGYDACMDRHRSTPILPMARWISLLVFIFLVAAVVLFGSSFQPGAWYGSINKPAWTPPNWVFGPVWTVLYIMIAVAGWYAWQNSPRSIHPVNITWAIQLLLNAAWSWLFFGLQRPGLALVDIALLLIAILAFIMIAWRVSLTASLLFMPYALWVGFATVLNLAIYLLN